MIVARKTRIAGNPRRVVRKRRPITKSVSNAAYLLTLGNPARKHKRRSTAPMAKPKRKRKGVAGRVNPRRIYARKSKSNSKHRRRTKKRGNPKMKTRTRTVKIFAKRKRHHNPFGVNISTKQTTEIAIGAIVGGGLTKVISTAAASNISELSGNAPLTVLADLFITGALWFGISKIPGASYFAFGAGVGGLIVTMDAAINAFAPGVYAVIPGGGLSGYRGVGDLVPGRLLEPYNPFTAVTGGYSGSGMNAAYPQKYTRAA
jgi:hypothetical protein